jgi:hypothetical protein
VRVGELGAQLLDGVDLDDDPAVEVVADVEPRYSCVGRAKQ